MRTRKKIPKGKREIKIKNKNKKKNEKKEKKVDKKKKKRQTEKPEQRESLQPGGLSAVSTHDMRRASNCYYSNAYHCVIILMQFVKLGFRGILVF